MAIGEELEVSEAQIAVHWREEEYIQPPPRFIGQANAPDPAIWTDVRRGALPGVLPGVRRPARLGPVLAHHPGHQRPAFLEVVRRRPAQRQLQLCRPAPGDARANKAALIWVPEPEAELTQTITYRELYRRVNEFAAMLRGFCGLKAATGSPSTCRWSPTCRCRCWPAPGSASFTPRSSPAFAAPPAAGASPTPAAGSWSPSTATTATANWSTTRPRPTRPWPGPSGGPGGRQGPGVAAPRRPVRVRDADGRGPRLLRGRCHRRVPARVVVPPTSMPAEAPLFLMYTSGTTGRPKGAQHSTGGYLVLRGRYLQVLPGHPPRRHLLVLRRHRLDHRPLLHRVRAAGARARPACCTRAPPPTPTPAGRGASPSGSGSTSSTPPRPPIRMLRKLGKDEPAKYDYHFKLMSRWASRSSPRCGAGTTKPWARARR